MTALWTAADIAAATGGTASADFAVSGIAFDSREIGAGDLFIALTGENDDGHRFVDGAFAKGAAGAIVVTLHRAVNLGIRRPRECSSKGLLRARLSD